VPRNHKTTHLNERKGDTAQMPPTSTGTGSSAELALVKMKQPIRQREAKGKVQVG